MLLNLESRRIDLVTTIVAVGGAEDDWAVEGGVELV